MANFDIAYNLERKHEGFYSNNPNDSGGETYAGIARNINPSWNGWQIVDSYKKAINRPLKNNEIVKHSDIENLVKEFYYKLWLNNNFHKIADQNVANILYDWFINSGYNSVNTKNRETFGIDEILNRDFNKQLKTDSRFDDQTINAINSVNSVNLYNTIKKERIKFYTDLVNRKPSQTVFLKGWLARINSFKDLNVKNVSGLLLLIIIVVLAVIYI